MPSQYAAIYDLGTNTFNLAVVRYTSHGHDIVCQDKHPVKIGEGGIDNGVLTAEAFSRALQGVAQLKLKATEYPIKMNKAFATSAFRSARNGHELADEIYRVHGIEVEIIDGQEEAGLIYEGVKLAMDLGSQPSLIIDIGGGSVEFIIANSEEIFAKFSYEIGAQRLLDKFHTADPMPRESEAKLFAYLESKLGDLKKAIDTYRPKVLVGSSGTFDTLCDMYHYYAPESIPPPGSTAMDLPVDFFNKLYEEFLTHDHQYRLNMPGMMAMRADMIVVAACLIKFTIFNYSFQNIRVSTFSLKEGVINRIKQTILA